MLLRNLHRIVVVAVAIIGGAIAIADSKGKFQVDTGYAIYQGRLSTSPNLTHPPVLYLGIPYGGSPAGSNRFRAPPQLDISSLSKERSKGKVIDATQYPEFCIQGTTGAGDAGGAGSEDCLKVNIYAPQNAKAGSNLPVLVYIHGGGYIYGNPANWPFDEWVSQSPNVVIVSVYYRLSSIGFLSHPSFSSSSSSNSPGTLNAGILDQRLALHWVNQNIRSFGGDASKVTIMGQSAGASSVELQLVATPPSETNSNIFRGAILQSIYRTPLPTPEQQLELFNSYAQLAGCGDALKKDNANGGGTVDQTMACLRSADISALARAQDANKNISYGAFHPVMDGQLFKDHPTSLLQKGQFHHSDIIAGSTSNESLAGGSTIQSALQSFFPSLTVNDITDIETHYPSSEFVSDNDRLTVLTGDQSVRCGRQITASAARAAGHKAYTYRFNALVPGATSVYHSSDNWYLFNGTATGFNGSTTFQPQSANAKAAAAEEIAYLLSFVRTSDPNTEKMAKSPVWQEWDPESSKKRIVLNVNNENLDKSTSVGEDVSDEEIERCLNSASFVDHEQN